MFFTPARYHIFARNHFLFLCFLSYPCFKKTKVAAPFSTQFSRIHTGTCPAIPIAHAATCSLCGVCCCPEHARILCFKKQGPGGRRSHSFETMSRPGNQQKNVCGYLLACMSPPCCDNQYGLTLFPTTPPMNMNSPHFAQSKHKSD